MEKINIKPCVVAAALIGTMGVMKVASMGVYPLQIL